MVLARAQFTIGFVQGVTGILDEAKNAIQSTLVSSRSAGDMIHHSLALTMGRSDQELGVGVHGGRSAAGAGAGDRP
jgi:hypothetical protein